MYRYRLIDSETEGDLGLLVSLRLTFAVGELLSRRGEKRFEVVNIVPAENENFRAYLVVRRP